MVTIVILKVIECWNSYVWPRLITDDPAYYLVSNGIQEIRENGFGRENIPAMMAAVVVISLPLIVLFLIFRKKIMAGRFKRRYQGMRTPMENSAGPAAGGRALRAWCLTGCHGAQGACRPFPCRMPLTTSRDYEITFWAKNDTNKTQMADVYKQAICGFCKGCIPTFTVNLRLYTNYGEIYNDVITNIATGTTPNVCITYPDHIATYLTGSNVVAPLDELMADEELRAGRHAA